jgi:hypothetical protein
MSILITSRQTTSEIVTAQAGGVNKTPDITASVIYGMKIVENCLTIKIALLGLWRKETLFKTGPAQE